METFFGTDTSWTILLLLLLAGTLAGFVDSIVGGGGLISVPAMLLTNLPPSMALGSNKCASVFGALSSSITFYRSGKVNWALVKKQLPFTLIGTVLGTLLVIAIPPLYLKPILIVLLLTVLIFVLFKRNWGEVNDFHGESKKVIRYCLLFAFAIGAYDGFIGPGTGTFLIFAFIFAGFDFLHAAGNAKVLNLASNAGSLVIFIMLGHVNFLYGGIMAVGQFAGAQLGSRLAIKKGSGLVRLVFLITTTAMIGKLLYDYIVTLL